MNTYTLRWYHSTPSYSTVPFIVRFICLDEYFKETRKRALIDYQSKLRVFL